MNYPSTRQQAKDEGSEWYFTGRPCPRGNVSLRKTSTSDCWCDDCRELVRKKSREDYHRNRERNLKKKKDYQAKNRSRYLEYQNKYREENRDVLLHKKKQDYWKRREVYRERNRQWIKNNPEVIRENNRNAKARRKGAEGQYENADVEALHKQQDGKCACCHVDFAETGYHVDHIMPIILGGTNWPYNLQLLCPPCNLRKGAKHPDEWAQEIGRLS